MKKAVEFIKKYIYLQALVVLVALLILSASFPYFPSALLSDFSLIALTVMIALAIVGVALSKYGKSQKIFFIVLLAVVLVIVFSLTWYCIYGIKEFYGWSADIY